MFLKRKWPPALGVRSVERKAPSGRTFVKTVSLGEALGLKQGSKKFPYRKLHIYEVDGILEGELPLGPSFIGNWIEDGTSFLFFSKPSDDLVIPLLERFNLKLKSKYTVDYEEWESGQLPEPFSVGDVEFRPVWCGSGGGENCIIFDPSVVFGSGFHPTTRGCLEAMWMLRNMGFSFDVVFDLGSGSGILSLFAVKIFSPKKVVAVDKNPLCVSCTRKNALLNGFDGTIDVVKADVSEISLREGDLILANLPYEVVFSLFDKNLISQKARVVMSGFMDGAYERIKEVYEKKGFKELFKFKRDLWVVAAILPKSSESTRL